VPSTAILFSSSFSPSYSPRSSSPLDTTPIPHQQQTGTFLLVLTVLFATDVAKTNQHSHMTALIPIPIGIVVMIDHFCL